jgi:hypothetical protein
MEQTLFFATFYVQKIASIFGRSEIASTNDHV